MWFLSCCRLPQIETVDRYQGSQNDFILLSLVRTKSVGHLRDVRRLIVAMSRARLGLYVFCRVPVFRACYELAPVFSQLMKRPVKLQLMPSEAYPATRKLSERPTGLHTVADMPAVGIFQDLPKSLRR